MSSRAAMSEKHVRRGIWADTARPRLAAILAAVLRLGQARCALGLGALIALVLALDSRQDSAGLLLVGAVGLLLLAAALFRPLPLRLLFAASSSLVLGAYAWAGTESLPLRAA